MVDTVPDDFSPSLGIADAEGLEKASDGHIELEGLPNTRDIGGIRAADGRYVKHARLLRSGALAGATERDLEVLLDDLEALPQAQWLGLRHDRFLADPQAEVRRLCDWAGLEWDRELGRQLPLSRYTLTAPDPAKWRRHEAAIEATRVTWEPLAARAEALLARR